MKFKSILLLLCLVVSSCNKTTQGDDPITKKEDFTVPPTNVDPKYPFRIVRVNPNPLPTAFGKRYSRESFWLRNFASETASIADWSISAKSIKPSLNLRWQQSSPLFPANELAEFGQEMFPQGSNVFADEGDTVVLIAPDKKIVQTFVYGKALPQQAFTAFEPSIQLRILSVTPYPNSGGEELISVENMTSDGINLTGWKFRSKGGQVKNLLDSDWKVGLVNNNTLPLFSSTLFGYTGAPWLNNDGDSLEIVNPSGTIIHKIGWGKLSQGKVIYP